MLIPKPLCIGDTIGIIAPAGQLAGEEKFIAGVKILQEMGFKVKFPRNLWPGHGYLADRDDNRIQEFHALLRDPEVKALLAVRGGYGCLRMIGGIDLELAAAIPKMIFGFSDITLLHNYLHDQKQLVTFHGPVLNSLCDLSEPALERFYRTLLGKWYEPIPIPKLEILRDGEMVAAPLAGGNLASLLTVLGTRFDFSWKNKIIFFEDINEPAYQVDRMLTQLFLAGKFDGVRGLLLGDFAFPAKDKKNEKLQYVESIWTRVLELSEEYDFPIVANLPIGHFAENFTVPMGISARLNSNRKQLEFSV